MSAVPIRGDLLIRNQTGYAPEPSFVVIDAITHAMVSGPFGTLRDATFAAASLAAVGTTIWQENVDLRGRELGSPVRLPIRPIAETRRMLSVRLRRSVAREHKR